MRIRIRLRRAQSLACFFMKPFRVCLKSSMIIVERKSDSTRIIPTAFKTLSQLNYKTLRKV